MRSLFARILVWFLVTVVVTAVGLGITTIIIMNEGQPERMPPIARTLPFLLNEARGAYERGGKEELAAFLLRVESFFETEAFLTDASGRDLITGTDRTVEIREAQRRPFRALRRGRMLFGGVSDRGDYRFVLAAPSPRRVTWEVLAPNLWLISAVLLCCYGLAYYLTKPLRQIERAVERFGQGDLSARTGSTRSDELGELARTFDRMAERIDTLMAAQKRLLMDISHELRSPLARLGVAVELARSGEDREAALARIERESGRLNALVGELLQVTRAEADPASRRWERIALDDLLRTLVDDAQIEAKPRGCRVELTTPGGIEIEGDPELLRRAVDNVIRNAIRYTADGTSVEVAVERREPGVRISIRDDGPGVPPEAAERIFDPFYRVNTDRDRSSGGVGLGLSIARRAVELHHGKIGAIHNGPGLRIEIDLPLAVERSGLEPRG